MGYSCLQQTLVAQLAAMERSQDTANHLNTLIDNPLSHRARPRVPPSFLHDSAMLRQLRRHLIHLALTVHRQFLTSLTRQIIQHNNAQQRVPATQPTNIQVKHTGRNNSQRTNRRLVAEL
jgi:RecJ-like exonuclease